MQFDSLEALPVRLEVAKIESSRYPSTGASMNGASFNAANSSAPPKRPLSWDDRVEGIDVIVTTAGKRVQLWSDGQQSPPLPGWGIIVTGGDATAGYRWTLYSLAKGATLPEGRRI